ncbi:S1 family peptidase [Arthrobacter sp. 35W]|uniref:S1 family peptidase n=1 Tax=Arthrobacter sp. 35W TaxID=1132441 RepID=UPI000408B2FC|nr:S1 family peptidase [Arthrobacter sp. 35W]
MPRILRSLLATAVAVVFAAAGSSAATAAVPLPPPGDSTYVIGGERADRTSWAVQLIFAQHGALYACTGVAIDDAWILTAQHCVAEITAMDVYYSNSTLERGTAEPADHVYGSPAGDVGLVHLAAPHGLRSYPDLAEGYEPSRHDNGTIMGYGLRADQRGAKGLYQADVAVVGSSIDAYGGAAVHIRGINGAANHGDSGGPLIIDDEIVAVCSTGDDSDPGANINAGSNYANLTASREWIRATTGI